LPSVDVVEHLVLIIRAKLFAMLLGYTVLITTLLLNGLPRSAP
jgi:hypothetical protein